MIAAEMPPKNQVPISIARDYVSYSALSTYQQCPLRYYFRYVAGLPEATVSASLAFGSAIHAAVEMHFQELLVGETPPSLDALVDAYQKAWQERGANVTFAASDDETGLTQTARRMLLAFQGSDFARPAGKIIGVEEELRGPVISGLPELLARLDLLVEEDEALVVSDLKTSRSRWSRDHADDAAEQLLLYSELAKQLVPGKPIRLEFAVVTKAQTPAVDRHVIESDPRRIARTKRIAQRVWQAIEAGHYYPAPSPMQCPTCPFRTPCRQWRG